MTTTHHDRLLAGLRVIDAGHVLAGPFVGTLLADLGAEVIKIELPELAKQGSKAGSALRAVEYRNKKSVTLNLRQPEGQELARKLVSVSDAFVENYSPGTMEKWGLGFDDLAKANPRIIMVRVSGYGQTGPYRDRTSYDRIGQAVGGMLYVTGEPERPPAHPGYMLGDYITGTFGALSILSAVYHRDHMSCDEPQIVDLSLYESVFRYSGQLAPEYSQTGYVRERAHRAPVVDSRRSVSKPRRQMGADSGAQPESLGALGQGHGATGIGVRSAFCRSRIPSGTCGRLARHHSGVGRRARRGRGLSHFE